jgi:hypothetical protein
VRFPVERSRLRIFAAVLPISDVFARRDRWPFSHFPLFSPTPFGLLSGRKNVPLFFCSLAAISLRIPWELEVQGMADHLLRREIKERKAVIDAELEEMRAKMWQAYEQCNQEFRKQGYCIPR